MKKYLILVIVFFIGISFAESQTSFITEPKNTAWLSYRNFTKKEFDSKVEELKETGYILTHVLAYQIKGKLYYGMVGQKNTDKLDWKVHLDLTSDRYHRYWKKYKEAGFRPIDIEAYTSSGLKFAGVWVENKDNIKWKSYRNMTGESYSELFQKNKKEGYRLEDMEMYNTRKGKRYAAIWVENSDNREWEQIRNMTRESYLARLDEYYKKGYTLVDFEAFRNKKKMQYAAIWHKLPVKLKNPVLTNRTEKQYKALLNEYIDKGYRQIDLEIYDTPDGLRYGGVWIENSSLVRYAHRIAIDTLIEGYQKEHSIPAISVAIMDNGRIMYKRGFGYADKKNKISANSETVYSLASISKTVGGLLSAIYATRNLANRGPILNLDNPTFFYLRCLPREHEHTIRDLLKHQGCVGHYGNTNPRMPEMNGRIFANQYEASEAIWDTPLNPDTPCLTGESTHYSTHAFTFLGAVLEELTNRDLSDLIREEITEPLNLTSFRVQFEGNRLPANPKRAVPYRGSNNKAMTYENSTWKILGGGLESNVVDLVRYGEATRTAKLINEAIRDTLLWNNNTNQYGLAWQIRSRNINGERRKIVEHGGSQAGARSHLMILEESGIVIAILTNSRFGVGEGEIHFPETLCSAIASEILK